MAERTDPMVAAAHDMAAEFEPGHVEIVRAVRTDDAKRIRDAAVTERVVDVLTTIAGATSAREMRALLASALSLYRKKTARPVAGKASAATGPEEEVRGGTDTRVTDAAETSVAAPASLGPAALALAELIDREWIASCLGQTGENPGAPAVRAMADPLNQDVLFAAVNEIAGEDFL